MGAVLSNVAANGCCSNRPHRSDQSELLACRKLSDFPMILVKENTDSILDHYTLHQQLGYGGFSRVHRATSKNMDLDRAVKELRKECVSDFEALQQEMELLMVMDHPNIIKLFETFQDNKHLYLLMNLCLGGELYDHIVEAGHFSEMDAACVMQQIFRAVFYMHSRCVIHRDIKLENILLKDRAPIRSANVMLIDFGLASRFTPGVLLTRACGTHTYIAPEVLARLYDEKADVWSCGVLNYILLCGYAPFKGNNNKSVLQAVMTGSHHFDPEHWSDISRHAQELVDNCLQRRSRHRISAEQALHHEWIEHTVPRVLTKNITHEVATRLQSYSRSNRVRKIALREVTTYLPEQDIGEAKDMFVSADEDGNGSLNVSEVKAAMQKANLMDGGDAREMVNGLDINHDGVVGYSEFLAATLELKNHLQQDIIQAVFRKFDLDGDGKISRAELTAVIAGICEERSPSRYTETERSDLEEVAAALQTHDPTGDGSIEFGEFAALLVK